MDLIIANIVKGNKKDLLIENDNIIFHITSTENQKQNKNENLTIIKPYSNTNKKYIIKIEL